MNRAEDNTEQAMASQSGEEFARLLAAHQRTIYIYLSSLQYGGSEVDDLFQETCVKCWQEFGSFKAGTNFGAWACTIAFNRVRAWRKKRSRSKVFLSDACLAAISDELIENESHYAERTQALQHCMQKLPEHHRDLLEARYYRLVAIEELAQKLERSADAVYRMLSRIRSVLHGCIQSQLKLEELS